jgi:hypothetical protein
MRPSAARVVPTRAVLLGVVVGVPFSLLMLYLAARGLDAQRTLHALTDADPLPLAVAVATFGLLYCVQAVRWRYVSRHVAVLPWRTFLRFIIAGVAINNVVPGRPGDLMRVFWLGRAAHIPPARALATVVVDRSADVLVLLGALAATYPVIPHPEWLDRLVLGALALGTTIAVLLIGMRWVGTRTSRDVTRIRGAWVRRHWAILARGAASSLTRRDLAVIGGLTIVGWSLWAAAAWMVATSVGVTLAPWQAVFITGLINLGSALPSSPGFIGTFQWLAVAGLGLMSVPHTQAFAFSVLLHAAWYVPTTVAGAVIALSASVGWFGGRPTVESPPA